jgi:hypothetical protein
MWLRDKARAMEVLYVGVRPGSGILLDLICGRGRWFHDPRSNEGYRPIREASSALQVVWL